DACMWPPGKAIPFLSCCVRRSKVVSLVLHRCGLDYGQLPTVYRYRFSNVADQCASRPFPSPCILNAPIPAQVPSMSLWISLHLPFHSLDAVFPLWSTKGLAAAVLDQDQVCALTPEAQEAGIVPGMRRGTAVALAPDVLLRRRDLQAEADGLRQALLCLLQYTPDIAILDPHSLVMDIAASLTLFGGPRALWRNVCRSLKGLGLTTRLAMAPTAQGAWALALQTQSRQRRVLRPRTLTKRLDSLPVDSLPALLPWLEWIHELGCFTLGQLRRLPRKGLQHRTRPEVIQTLDAAYGSSTPLYTWASLSETFQQRYETLQRLEHVHAVLGIAHVLVEQLCGWLQAGHSAADQL